MSKLKDELQEVKRGLQSEIDKVTNDCTQTNIRLSVLNERLEAQLMEEVERSESLMQELEMHRRGEAQCKDISLELSNCKALMIELERQLLEATNGKEELLSQLAISCYNGDELQKQVCMSEELVPELKDKLV